MILFCWFHGGGRVGRRPREEFSSLYLWSSIPKVYGECSGGLVKGMQVSVFSITWWVEKLDSVCVKSLIDTRLVMVLCTIK